MVKERGLPMGCVVLLWVRLPLADTDSAGFNRLLEQAASLSITLLEEKCIHQKAVTKEDTRHAWDIYRQFSRIVKKNLSPSRKFIYNYVKAL